MKFSMKLEGFDGLSVKLRELPKRVENKVLQQATRQALMDHLSEMKLAAPIDVDGRSEASKKYGRLRDNIRVVNVRKPKRKTKAARFDTKNAFWGAFYELGTSRQPARPFFGRKFRSMSNSILSKLSEYLRQGIIRESKNG